MPLSTAEFARQLGISRVRVLGMIKQGYIKNVCRVGRLYSIPESELKRFEKYKHGKVTRVKRLD